MTSLPAPYNLIGLIVTLVIVLGILAGVLVIITRLGYRPAHKSPPDKVLPPPTTRLLPPAETEEVTP